MNARSCPTCQSVGPRRMLGDDPAGPLPCGDTWHDPSPGTSGAMVSTSSLPTRPELEPVGPALAFEVQLKPGADADDSLAVLKAVLSELDGKVADVVTVTDVGRLHEDLRQANLRHRMAEREAADLRNEVERLASLNDPDVCLEEDHRGLIAHMEGRVVTLLATVDQLRGIVQLACNMAVESGGRGAADQAQALLREADGL